MGVLQRFERRLEFLVNGAFARTFKSAVQPVEIASSLQRECDDRAAIVAQGRTMAPNAFTVELGPRDYDRLATYAEPLGSELAEMVSDHAREQHYTFLGPVSVEFTRVEELQTGLFRVQSRAQHAAQQASRPPPSRPDQLDSTTRLTTPPGWLEVDGQRHPLTAAVTTLGRGSETDVHLEDLGVSRRHCEIRPGRTGEDGGDPVIIDLGSTNGTMVDGQRISRAVLRDGSRIMVGGTEIRYRRPAAAP